jgi:hypothetical protein
MKNKPLFQDRARAITQVNRILMVLASLYFLILPAILILFGVSEPALRNGGIPRSAVYLFKQLTPRYEKWARERIASGIAGDLTGANISGTEWPPFGSAFYLWALESLQKAWDGGDHFMVQAPKDYARGAIEASTALILDPNTAGWVRKYWGGGDQYLHQEDIFYRMLMISAATTYQKLTGDTRYLPILRDQVETLSSEVDRSKFGLLDDYPQQCFPADVVAAVANIREADPLLGTDHSRFAQRAQRGFQGDLADSRGLPPYMADSKQGETWGPSRGCSNSYLCLFAPQAWPEFGSQLYGSYDQYFWQVRWGAAGFREFPNDMSGYNWYWDVDSGPVVAGHGISACAFGVGAARVNGRMDRAYPVAAEMLAFSWPLPDGTLLLPRILSNATDAPYVGEASILFNLTRQPLPGVPVVMGGSLPWVVTLFILILLARAFFLLRSAFRGPKDSGDKKVYPLGHFLLWGTLVLLFIFGIASSHFVWALVFYVLAQFFPLKIAGKASRARGGVQ